MMESGRRNPGQDLDRAVEEMRRAEPRPAEIEESASRVWTRISEDTRAAGGSSSGFVVRALRTCADYQSLVAEYRAGRLSEARTLLLEDHSRECPSCRRALTRGSSTGPAAEPIRRGRDSLKRTWVLSGIAAAVLVVLAAGQSGLVRHLLFPVDASAVLRTIRGQLFRVNGPTLEILEAGAEIGARQVIRTGRGSGTIVELADGSRVEMRERSELALVPARDGVRIALDRGGVIVRAAEQGSGHLYVSTEDVDVAVVGTVFAVSAGAKGARVSVLEGEVVVEHGAVVESLLAGEQYNGSDTLTAVPIEEEIAWSQELETHLALLEAFSRMRGELEGALLSPGLRYTSSLIALVPEDTVLYAAFPNVALTLTDAYDVFSRRIQENPVTADWWATTAASAEADGLVIDAMIEQIRSVSEWLGSELVVAVGHGGAPVFLAEVRDASGLAELMRAVPVESEPLRVATSLADLEAAAATDGPVAYIEDGLLALSPVPALAVEVASGRESGSGFASRAFYRSLTAAYADGADWLFAVDTAALGGESAPAFDLVGLESLRDMVVDHKIVEGQSATRAVMHFDESPGGMASWIGAPGPMGALDFVSPESFGVLAGLSRDPARILDEMFGAIQEHSPDAWGAVLDFQQQHAIDLENDVAAALGGEFLIAIDGALVPETSWKAVVEVYDSARLQNAVERIVAALNRLAAEQGAPGLEITAESVGGQIYHVIRAGSGQEMHYAYSGGYMVAAPRRALVIQALEYSQTRYSLGSASAFRDLFPAGEANDCSAILYQNMTPLVSSIGDYADMLVPEQLEGIEEIVSAAPPMLTCITAETDRIVAWNQGELAFNMVTLGGLSAIVDMLDEIR